MTRLDDFLQPLDEGVWEIVIPKGEVTDPLDAGWRMSAINVPSPGTIASFRKGRFHVHETTSTWRVHLDRYDPKVHPVMHLLDDAPLLLMISDTFMTLIMDTRRSEMTGTAAVLKTQRFIWQEQEVSGLILLLVGLFILNDPFGFFMGLFEKLIPLAIIGLSLLIFRNAFHAGLSWNYRITDLFHGTAALGAGICAFFFPFALWVLIVLALLTLRMVASALVLLRRVMKGRQAVPEGFYSRMALGILSLVTGVLLVVSPAAVLNLLVVILGAITLLLGITLGINGMRLRWWMEQLPATG